MISEIHLGGGTPTFFSPKHLKQLIEGILSKSRLTDEYEFSFEGHPNNTTEDHLQTLYDLGFRRCSYGIQDYNLKIQKAINRIQPEENVRVAHGLAKEIGYTSISHDLVFGLPHQTLEDIQRSIDITAQLKPDRISLYSYAHVPWIKGLGQRGFDENDLPTGEEKRQLYEYAKKHLQECGYHEVGMDHFALETDSLYQSMSARKLHRNFMGYTTTNTDLMIGLGMSSISDSWLGFAQNDKDLKSYQESIDKGELAVFRGHILSNEELIIRRNILDLMCHFETSWNDGLAIESKSEIIERLVPLEEDGLLQITSDGVSVESAGEPFIRNICMAFDLLLHRNKPNTRLFSDTI